MKGGQTLNSTLTAFIEAVKKGRLQHCVHEEWSNCDLENITIGYLLRARDFRIVERNNHSRPLEVPFCCGCAMADVTTQETATWGELEYYCTICGEYARRDMPKS